jgi:hypothetical protein
MNYPKAIKAFYMRLNDDGRTVAAMDVLAPGIGEIIGGGQREERLDVLDRNMTERGIDREHYAWYRDLRRYGTVPHAGFGLGFERTLAYVTGLANVRDAIPFRERPGMRGIDVASAGADAPPSCRVRNCARFRHSQPRTCSRSRCGSLGRRPGRSPIRYRQPVPAANRSRAAGSGPPSCQSGFRHPVTLAIFARWSSA